MKLQKVLVGLVGLFTFCNGALAQHDGSLDITFNPGSGPNLPVFAVALATNGDVLIGGEFTSVNGQTRNYVARLNPDGSVDGSFLPGQGPGYAPYSQVPPYVLAVEPAPDGGVYIGGYFGTYNGVQTLYIAKLRADASLDLSWPNVAFNNGPVNSIQCQADGTVLVQGGFSTIGAVARNGLAKFNSDASLNLSFNPAGGVTNGSINAFAIQPDGNVIIAGSFTTNNPVSRQNIARVNQSGVLDSTFNAGYIGGGSIQAVVLQTDGKVIVGGGFTSINGYSRLGVARLNTNGTVDTTFVLSPGIANPTFDGISVLSDGKVMLWGAFSLGQNYGGLVRLNPDGSNDGMFNPQANGIVNAAAVQPDGKVLAGGYFSSISGTNINYLARLIGTSTNTPGLQFLSINRYAGMFLGGTVSNTYRVEWTTNLNTPSLWNPLFNVTLQSNPQFVLDTNPISGRQRFYRAVALP
jgi:uncharacterized delta-60 repeat protein